METVGEKKLWSFIDQETKIAKVKCSTIRGSSGYKVDSFLNLAKCVAELQFRNRDLLLMFRGQPLDKKNQATNTSLKPTIFRCETSRINQDEFKHRYCTLNKAEAELIEAYKTSGMRDIKTLLRQQIVRWSILQHYQVCDTPMLDLTHSLRIAASFASLKKTDESYVMVVGVPNLSGAITACADAGVQIIRLSGVCPPSAIRPHIQEGYLLTEYPEMSSFDQTLQYKPFEMDFGRRLVAKFKFEPKEFWKKSKGFPQIKENALYPKADPMLKITQAIQQKL